MKMLFVLLLTVYVAQTFAIEMELDLAQSSPSQKWYSIENDVVRVIYPESIKSESVYIANLVEHYSHVVGKTYGISKPRLFNLVIRPEMGEPNGYVTLAPRRSEWFASSMYFPFVGTTEWYQTLSIHEYRHVNQMDHALTGGTRFLYYLMGETGWQLGTGIALPSWYLEGDAVWAETKYTDGGRGRSPRFISRLKALVLSDKIPTYDQFLSGSYKTNLPNQYVYGYALISYATQKFGENVWKKVTEDAASYPYPLRFYTSFERVTGQKFESFYAETMQDLRKKWASDSFVESKPTEFRETSAPFKVGESLYYVKQTLDTHAQLIREKNGRSEVVFELPYSKELQILDIKGHHAVYTEFLPDERYGHKGSSDLVVVDLNTGKKQQITNDQRIYNPRFNDSGTKIVAIEFKADQTWNISEFDLSGKYLKQFQLSEGKVAEAAFLDDETIVSIINDKAGNKYIATVDLEDRKIGKTLVPASRNLIHSLYVDKNKNIFFEAQYKGYTEIFKLSPDQILGQCSQSKLGSYAPSSDGETLFLSEEDINGSFVKSVSLANCKSIPLKDIIDFNYLGDTASDAYNKFPVQRFNDQKTLFTKNAQNYKPQEYSDFDLKLFVPHSWGLTIGRGSGLGFKSDNFLRTLGFSAFLGQDPEEKVSFTELNFDIRKYYPLIRIQLEDRNRETQDYLTTSTTEWEEQAVGLAVLVPYIKKYGLQNFVASLSLEGSYLDTSNYNINKVSIGDQSKYFYKSGAGLGLTWSEDLKSRSIIAPWLISYSADYEDADAPNDSTLSSYRILQEVQVNIPAFGKHDGFMFTFDEQKQKESFSSYRFLPKSSAISYALSRGYGYEDVPYFQKVTGNYIFPIAYPDKNLGRWYYLKRIYTTLFYDSTRVKTQGINETLDSYGVEVLFESKLLRFMPLTFGGRVLQNIEEDQIESEFFLATELGF